MKSSVLFAVCGIVSVLSLPAARGESIDVFIRLIEETVAASREPGVLTELTVQEGTVVQEGDRLARVEDRLAEIAVRRAELELLVASEEAEDDVIIRASEKAAAVAKNDWDRAKRTIEKSANALSESEVDHFRLTAERAALEVEKARRDYQIAQIKRDLKQSELDFARRQLERHSIPAPIDGMVVQLNRRRGEWVEPGEDVLRIVRIDRLRAEGYIDADQARLVQIGTPIKLNVQIERGKTTDFAGKIVFVSPEIDPVNGQVAVWAEVENRDLQLRPGLRATMAIESAK